MYGREVLDPVASSDHHLLNTVVAGVVIKVVDIALMKRHIVICRTCAEVDVRTVVVEVVAVVGNDVAPVPILLDRYRGLEVQWVVDARTLRWVGGCGCMCREQYMW